MPRHMHQPPPHRIRLFLLLLVIPWLAACHTLAPLPPVDLTLPGWELHRGQAVWHSPDKSTELAGDLLVASRPDGHALLEFTKASWPLVVVRITPDAWQLESAATGQRRSGRGTPPARSAWLVLPRCLAGAPAPKGWSFTREPDNGWTLEHPRSGESLHGYLLP
jgi:hypothetical protein